MTNRQGTPIWYELATRDADASEAFYGHVVGWRFQRPPGGMGRDYRIAETNGAGIAGFLPAASEQAMPSAWSVYFGVDDVDRSVEGARAAGAEIHVPPTDIPGVGRFAVLADPQANAFHVMRGSSDEPSHAFQCGEAPPAGHAVWNELTTPDPQGAIAFYGRVLGIRQEGGMPMGELGDYSFLHAGPDCIGAVMAPPPGSPPGWIVYFSVEDIDQALKRVTDGGGSSVQGPDEIPGGAFALVAEDPAGARFGLVGPRAA